MNPQELQQSMEQSQDRLYKLASEFSQDEFNAIPFAGSWTPAQVVQHLLNSYGLAQILEGKTQPTERDPMEKDAILRGIFLDFSTKLKSPDFIMPEVKHYDRVQVLRELKKANESLRKGTELPDLELTCLDFQMPQMGTLTRAELLWFVVHHTKRHIHQLEKIREAAE